MAPKRRTTRDNSNEPISGLNFETNDSIVAYIDVLGFKAMIDSNNTKLVEWYFNSILDILAGLQSLKGPNLKKTLLSDTIILSFPVNANPTFALQQVIHATAKIQRALLENKILTRGGISCGSLYLNERNNVLVGSGLVRAHIHEDFAKYPRVVLDPTLTTLGFNSPLDLAQAMNQGGNLVSDIEYSDRNINSRLDQRFLFVDYLRYYDAFHTINKEKILSYIDKNLKKTNTPHFEKYEWLCYYFMHTFPAYKTANNRNF